MAQGGAVTTPPCSVLKLLRLADTFDGIAQAGINESVDPLKDLSVGGLPVLAIIPGRRVPREAHSNVLGRPIKLMNFGLPTAGTFIRVDETASVGRRAKKVSGLLPSGILVCGHEDGVALPRDNLDGLAIIVDLHRRCESQPQQDEQPRGEPITPVPHASFSGMIAATLSCSVRRSSRSS